MNLKNWIWNRFGAKCAVSGRFVEGIFGQSVPSRLELGSIKPFMLLLLPARRAVVCLGAIFFLAVPAAVFGQTNYYDANGTEYAVIGTLPGDQVFPDVAVATNGGFVVWQDNITDGSGEGVSARRLDSTLSGTLSTFRVNVQGTNDQSNPRVSLLKSGGAAFVWQGGKQGGQRIFARFLTPTNTWLMNTDIVVSTFSNYFQVNPAVATLNDSNIIVVWASFNQAKSNSLQDIYGQILSPVGKPVGTNFLINQFIPYNQRTPAVAALKNGGFAVAWISDQERVVVGAASPTAILPSQIVNPSVDVYARLYNSNGVAQSSEFLVNTDSNPCASPNIAAASDGTFAIVWGARDMTNADNSLDIFMRSFSGTNAVGGVTRVNSYTYGDQFAPRISSIGTNYMVVWTSLGQDGSREGVFGQFLQGNGTAVGGEFLVNTTTISQQMQPTVASDGKNQFLVVWTSFTGAQDGFDLFAQRYINSLAVLQPMSAPFVYAPFVLNNGVYQPQLQVSWAPVQGISISNYEVYVDDSPTSTVVVAGISNQWTMTAANGLTASSTHSFQLDYVTSDGQRSPGSPSVSASTWSGLSWQGIPFEWMAQYFGGDTNAWPSATADSDGDGMNNLQEFLAGTDPTDPNSVLRLQLTKTREGMFLSWPTQPGLTYQVQTTTDFVTWVNLGSARFAAGTSDSIYVGSSSMGYYRILLLR
jgi:hypothetical protein